MNKEILLEKSYKHFCFALSAKDGFPINRRIHTKVEILNARYSLNVDEIISELFENYVSREHFRKYNSNKASLSTFITSYVDRYLNNLGRKYNRHPNSRKKIQLPGDEKTDIFDEYRRYSLSYLEQYDFNCSLAYYLTPEHYLIAKQLYEEIVFFFGLHDSSVLLGGIERKDEAFRLGIKEETYRKRLTRKKVLFKGRLEGLGYDC
jgi:hypothetical protein